jgi:fumarate reductase subunit C
MKGKEYIRPIPAAWYLQRPTWKRFILRELTAIFVGAYAIFLLVLIRRAADASSFAAFVEGLRSPVSIVFHLIVLAMALYHSVTWFSLLPLAMHFQRGEEHVAPKVIAATGYVAWVLASIVVVLLFIWLR